MSGSKRLSIRAGTVLARNTFDTDLLPPDAIRLDAYCELNGIPLRFLPTAGNHRVPMTAP